MNKNIENLKKDIIPILKKAGVLRSALFGSMARNEATTHSDIDLLIELKKGVGLFGFVNLKNQLEEILRKKVDLVEYEALKPRLKNKILKEQILIL